MVDRPNPHDVIGGLVGGPDSMDRFQDDRALYEFSEVRICSKCQNLLKSTSVAPYPYVTLCPGVHVVICLVSGLSRL